MISQVSQPRLKGFRSSRPISNAVWAYHRFGLSLRDVEDLLAEQGVIVSYQSIRVWCQRFGTQIAAKTHRDCPVPSDKWRLDEVVISIRGRKQSLWRAIDTHDEEKRSWGVSNAHARRRVNYPSTIKPPPSSVQNATAIPKHPTANLGLTRSACGTTVRLKWLHERDADLCHVTTLQPDKALPRSP